MKYLVTAAAIAAALALGAPASAQIVNGNTANSDTAAPGTKHSTSNSSSNTAVPAGQAMDSMLGTNSTKPLDNSVGMKHRKHTANGDTAGSPGNTAPRQGMAGN